MLDSELHERITLLPDSRKSSVNVGGMSEGKSEGRFENRRQPCGVSQAQSNGNSTYVFAAFT